MALVAVVLDGAVMLVVLLVAGAAAVDGELLELLELPQPASAQASAARARRGTRRPAMSSAERYW